MERIGIRQGATNKPIITLVPYPLLLLYSLKLFVVIGGLRTVCTLVKDVVFKEDTTPLKHHNAASNLSLIRNIVINVAHRHGYDSRTIAERFLSHNIDLLISLLE